MAFSPNSNQVVVATSKHQSGKMHNSLQLWKTDDATPVGKWETDAQVSLRWSNHNNRILTASNVVEMWDVNQQACLWQYALSPSQYVHTLRQSQCGRWIALRYQSRLKILDSDSQTEVWHKEYPVANGGIEFGSTTGLLYTSDAQKALHLWNPKTGDRVRRIVFPSAWCDAGIVVNENENTLIYARTGLEQFNGVGLMSLHTGQEHQQVAADCHVRCVALRKDKLLIFGEDGSLRVRAMESRTDTSVRDTTTLSITRIAPLKLDFPPSRFHSRGHTLDFTTIEAFQKTARTAVRLHPRRAQEPLPNHVSKIGGATDLVDRLGGGILWPAEEAWPVCKHDGRALIPILQLLKHDFPELDFPKGRDVFQLLWCPERHDDFDWGPVAEVFWRASQDIDVVAQPLDLLDIVNSENEMLVPYECELNPERIVEFDTSSDAYEIIEQLETESLEPVDYQPIAPGCKIGGYPDFAQDPYYPPCEVSGQPMEHLLSIADHEFDGSSYRRWMTKEDWPRRDENDPSICEPTGIIIGGGGYFHVFTSRQMSPDIVKTVHQ